MNAAEYAAASRRVADTLDLLRPRVLARVWIGLDEAALCLDCESVYKKDQFCPACGSANGTPLLAFLGP